MISYHKHILKILNISNTEAIEKYKLHPIEINIVKIWQNILNKKIQEPDHPVTTSLIKNIRSTTIFNLYKTKIAKTESHNQSFVLKCIRILRDKRVEQKKNCTKRLITHNPTHNQIICQQCGIPVKNKTGLSAYHRLRKNCSLVSKEITTSLNITLRK
jgi:hypothetical protein